MKTEVNNFWKTYLEYDDEDLKETREFLKEAGIDIEEARKKFSELLMLKGKEIKEEIARKRKEEGRKRQDIFDKCILTEKLDQITEKLSGNTKLQLEFREGQIGEDEKKEIEERDRKKLKRFREMNKGGEKE